MYDTLNYSERNKNLILLRIQTLIQALPVVAIYFHTIHCLAIELSKKEFSECRKNIFARK